MPKLHEIPEVFQTSEFRRLFILAEIGNFTASELEEYEKSLTSMSDYYNIIDSAEKRAREEGLLQGRLEGHAEGLVEAARKMLASGMAFEEVADILQIPADLLKDGC